jgi:phosphopentomutase
VPTLLDRAADAGLSVAAFASWEKLERAVSARPGRFPVSAGRASDDHTPPWPGSGHYRPDWKTADLALAYLETARPDFLYIALGDPDEHAHHGNVAGYRESLGQADDILRRLRVVLNGLGERGQATHVFVTADHGRANDFRTHGDHAPESARVWLVGAGPRIQARGMSRSPHERRLSDVAPTIASLIGIEPAHGPGSGEVLAELF